MLKTRFTDEEKIGMSEQEILLAEKYLRKFKTRGKLQMPTSQKLYELFMIGYSVTDIHVQFPQYSIAQIGLTCAVEKWGKDRDVACISIKERVQSKVVKSIIEQVDYLTAMIAVNNVENMKEMIEYISDPVNNPKPKVRIESIKEYKEVAEMLSKLISATSNGSKSSPLLDAITPKQQQIKHIEQETKKIEDEEDDISFDDIDVEK